MGVRRERVGIPPYSSRKYEVKCVVDDDHAMRAWPTQVLALKATLVSQVDTMSLGQMWEVRWRITQRKHEYSQSKVKGVRSGCRPWKMTWQYERAQILIL